MTRRPAPIQDRQLEIALGLALFIAGAWLVHDAFEGRGHKRPFPARLFLP